MIYVKELAEIIVKQGLMMEALQRDISEVVKQRDESALRITDFEDRLLKDALEFERLQQSNNALAADNNRRQEIEQMLNASLDKLVQQNAELTNRFQALQQGNVDLSNKVAELETENAVLADQAAVLQLQNNDLRDEIKAHVITADNLRDRINAGRAVLLSNRNDINQTWVDDVDTILQPKAQQ